MISYRKWHDSSTICNFLKRDLNRFDNRAHDGMMIFFFFSPIKSTHNFMQIIIVFFFFLFFFFKFLHNFFFCKFNFFKIKTTFGVVCFYRAEMWRIVCRVSAGCCWPPPPPAIWNSASGPSPPVICTCPMLWWGEDDDEEDDEVSLCLRLMLTTLPLLLDATNPWPMGPSEPADSTSSICYTSKMDGRRQVSFIATYSFPYCMLKVVIVATRRRALTCYISCLDRFSILLFLKERSKWTANTTDDDPDFSPFMAMSIQGAVNIKWEKRHCRVLSRVAADWGEIVTHGRWNLCLTRLAHRFQPGTCTRK